MLKVNSRKTEEREDNDLETIGDISKEAVQTDESEDLFDWEFRGSAKDDHKSLKESLMETSQGLTKQMEETAKLADKPHEEKNVTK